MALAGGACGTPQGEVSSTAIAVDTSGGLSAFGGPPGAAPYAMLIDTGAVFTTRAVGGVQTLQNGTLRLYDFGPDGGVPRAEFDDVPILQAPLAPTGVDTALRSWGGVLGGDLLSRFSVAIDYLARSITLRHAESDCSCQLAAGCRAVLPFTLAGGGMVQLGGPGSDGGSLGGGEIHASPSTRLTLDACLEAAADAPAETTCLRSNQTHAPGFEIDRPPGVGVKLLVATGFDGLLLGASAWDRLRGAGSAAALLAGPTRKLYFVGSSAPVTAAVASLGNAEGACGPSSGNPDGGTSGARCDALTLVGREGLLGPCEELARSRRLRWAGANLGTQAGGPDCNAADSACATTGCLRCLPSGVSGDPNRENDVNQAAAAYVELLGQIPVYVVDDAAPVLLEVNGDVRPSLPDVEGIAGTEVLRRLSVHLDYPGNRVIASCADDNCHTYPRWVCPAKVSDNPSCGPHNSDVSSVCAPPSTITATARGGALPCP